MKINFNFPLEGRALQYVSAFTCLLISICSGLHAGWPSPYLPILLEKNSTLPMTIEESSWVAIIYLAGGPFGAFITGVTLDCVGRKTVLLLSSVAFFISWILIAFANNLLILLVARFLAGFSDGLVYGAVPIYFGEICDPKIRGLLGSCITVTFLVGILFANIIGSYLSIRNSGVLCAAVPVIFLITFMWMPESPNFFLIRNNTKKAKNSLVKLKGAQEADRHLGLLVEAIEKENLSAARFIFLFKKINRKSLFIVAGLRLSQQFTGVVAFTFYAQTVFKEAGDTISPLLSVVLFYSLQIGFSLASSMFVDKVGRKPLLIISTVGSGVALLGAGFFFLTRDVIGVDTAIVAWFPHLALILFIISFSVGLQTVPIFLGAEIFPTNIKAYAAAISDVYYYVFALIASKFFQFTKDEYGIYVPFFTFALFCVFGLIIIVYWVPETKNKTLEEIQIELKNEKKATKM